MSTLTESNLESQLQRMANIDKIKHVWHRVKARERQQIKLDRLDETDELNFNTENYDD
jgi:hypothetical protein